jgi:hypothetical protein
LKDGSLCVYESDIDWHHITDEELTFLEDYCEIVEDGQPLWSALDDDFIISNNSEDTTDPFHASDTYYAGDKWREIE